MGGKKGSIANHVRRIRLARTDLTQSEMARRIGVTRQTVIAIEAQRYAPSLELAFRIAHVLRTPITEVFIFDPATMPES